MDHFINVYYSFTNLIPTDIYPVQYGEEQCESSHYFGPCIRSNYLLHYIYSGNGILKVNNIEYRLSKGQMFLIRPNELAYYKADKNTPWLYRWIEFNGSMSDEILKIAGFKENIYFINDNHDLSIGNSLLDIINKGNMCFELLMEYFWKFIHSITQKSNGYFESSASEYIHKAESFIKINIHKKITVNDVAGYIGIDRSYLCRLFKRYKSVSPQEYIIKLKINTAAQYLKNSSITISEAAQSVGYLDTHIFNKNFKKYFNAAPSVWRQKKLWEQSIIDIF